MLVVRGAVKDYDWGIVDGLARWSGERTGRPQAELWFGVHPGGPSPLVDDAAGQGVLADHFDVEHIPILVKLLAAAQPLSVQVHPTAERAASLWDAQRRGAGPTVLADPFEKTEMLIALGEFHAFAGWRDAAQAARFVGALPGCEAAADLVAGGERPAAIVRLLATASVAEAVATLPAAAEAVGLGGDELDAYRTVAATFPGDAGALATPLLGFVTLAEGEAIYVPAGIPHSYVRGTGVEVMTSSDNVLRMGLTPKAVFVEEALGSLALEAEPLVIRASIGDLLAPEGAPFRATLVRHASRDVPAGRYRIVLLIDGDARVSTAAAAIDLHPGTAAVLAADDPDASVTVNGLAAVITAPGAPRRGNPEA